MIDGVRYRVTCKALGLPESKWSKAESRAAANAYFEQTAEKRVLDKYAAHPELAPYKQALESAKTVGDETEVGTLTAFMDEVASRPSGATTDGTILLQKRRSLEDLLEVDLSHVPLGIIEELTIKRDVRFKLRERLRGKEAVDPDRTDKHLVAVYLTQRQQSEEKQLKATATVEFDRYNLRRMAVGWQTVAETINATVVRFNAKFFQPGTGPHDEMKLIAAKQAVMASLKELLVGLATGGTCLPEQATCPTNPSDFGSSWSRPFGRSTSSRPSATVPFTSGITSNRPSNWQRCTRASGTRTSTP